MKTKSPCIFLLRWRSLFITGIVFVFCVFNAIAFMQARAMTHFVATGQKIPKIETLSLPQKVKLLFMGIAVARPINEQKPSALGLTYQTHIIPLSSTKFLEVWSISHPNSLGVVLLFPGYAQSKTTLLTTASVFYELGYSMLLVDFRGVGGSSGVDTTMGVREAADVTAAVDFARSQWPNQSTILFGVSMGSASILRAIRYHHIQPDAIILESPFNRLRDTVGNRFRLMGLPASPASEILLIWGSVQLGFNAFAHNPMNDTAFVTCPTLILVGEHDTRATPEQAEMVFEQILSQKYFALVPGAEHSSLLVETAPARWDKEVKWLLGQVVR